MPARTLTSILARALVSTLGAALLLCCAACNNPSGDSTVGGRTPGEPLRPTATNPTGSAGGAASGGGVPIPTRPGGAGGVGSGNQPGQGGT